MIDQLHDFFQIPTQWDTFSSIEKYFFAIFFLLKFFLISNNILHCLPDKKDYEYLF